MPRPGPAGAGGAAHWAGGGGGELGGRLPGPGEGQGCQVSLVSLGVDAASGESESLVRNRDLCP